jgi:RNA polymerase sigma-70 factor (ECF subfamily)
LAQKHGLWPLCDVEIRPTILKISLTAMAPFLLGLMSLSLSLVCLMHPKFKSSNLNKRLDLPACCYKISFIRFRQICIAGTNTAPEHTPVTVNNAKMDLKNCKVVDEFPDRERKTMSTLSLYHKAAPSSSPSAHEVTGLLRAWSHGDEKALEKLIPIVYGELRRIAHRYMVRERSDHPLQTTALVHEAYLRLIDAKLRWRNRAQFFGISARVMRRILVEIARSRASQKHGWKGLTVLIAEAARVSKNQGFGVLELDEALKAFEKVDPRRAQVVELRFFGGMSVKETAKMLEVSPETIMRDWRLAKAWLSRQLSVESSASPVTSRSG